MCRSVEATHGTGVGMTGSHFLNGIGSINVQIYFFIQLKQKYGLFYQLPIAQRKGKKAAG